MILLLGYLACRAPSEEAPRACNGAEALCERPLDQVAFPGTHNAMSNADEGWTFPNQHHGLERQLQDGVRAFLMDTYLDEDGVPALCHGTCSAGSRPLLDALEAFRAFLDENPGEVLIFILQDDLSVDETAAVLQQSGLQDFVYTWDGGAWPTLGALAEAGTRLVVSAENEGPPPDWYHHAWDLFWDTPYDFDSAEEFSCALNRGSADNPLFLVNHWIGPLPYDARAAEVNVYEVLYARAAQCQEEGGQIPSVVAVDFYDEGDLFEVVAALNGL